MPRPREYTSNAERQEAYRARHRGRELPTQASLASYARSLHGWLHQAVRAGRSPWPQDLLGARADETMHNLIRYLRAHTEGDTEG